MIFTSSAGEKYMKKISKGFFHISSKILPYGFLDSVSCFVCIIYIIIIYVLETETSNA